MRVLVKESGVNASAQEVFKWHARPGAFERLNPPWNPVELVERTGSIKDGDRVTIANKIGPLKFKWELEHRDYVEGQQFRDVQIRGPFKHWEHLHSIKPDGPDHSQLIDRLEFVAPLGALGDWLVAHRVREQLDRVFEYRHQTLTADIDDHRKRGGQDALNILVTGSSGLIGSALIPFLTSGGHKVTRLVRTRGNYGEGIIQWDPERGIIDAAELENLDAVVHLAGENVAAGRWTRERKRRIRESRVAGTKLLSETLASRKSPPPVLVAASAVGYYGHRDDQILTEESPGGRGFLAEVVREWEASTAPAAQSGIRVVNLRFGVVLSPIGGALAKMRWPFMLGAGGPVGSGDQYVSWIAIDDAIGSIYHAINTEGLEGPVNAVTPNPVTNSQFSKTLAKVLRRPAVLPMPATVARIALGEMADETLLASTRVEPLKLQSTGYEFRFPHLEDALRHLLGRVNS